MIKAAQIISALIVLHSQCLSLQVLLNIVVLEFYTVISCNTDTSPL